MSGSNFDEDRKIRDFMNVVEAIFLELFSGFIRLLGVGCSGYKLPVHELAMALFISFISDQLIIIKSKAGISDGTGGCLY